MPICSIVVPVYNTEPYLPECLDSVFSQNLKDLEVIVVNDHSLDNSAEILKKYDRKETRMRLLTHSQNLGLSAARNSGFDAAVGKFVFFLDSDDILPPSALERLVEIAENDQADIVRGRFQIRQDNADGSFNLHKNHRQLKIFNKEVRKTNIRDYPLLGICGMVCEYIFRRNFLNKFSIRHYEELCRREANPFLLNALLNSQTVSLIEDITFVYRKRAENKPPSAQQIFGTDEAGYLFRQLQLVEELFSRPSSLYSLEEMSSAKFYASMICFNKLSRRIIPHWIKNISGESLKLKMEQAFELNRKISLNEKDFQKGLPPAKNGPATRKQILINRALKRQDIEMVEKTSKLPSNAKTIYLHVGYQKTGSTALQFFLLKNRNKLREHGIQYPKTGLLRNAHHRFMASFGMPSTEWGKPEKSPEEYFKEFKEEIESSKCSSVVISSEDFSYFDDLERVVEGFYEYHVRIVVYLRRQDNFIQSRMRHYIKSFHHKYTKEEIPEDLWGHADYAEKIDNWLKYIDKEDILIRVYEKGQLKGGNVFSDFLDCFGLTLEDGFFIPEKEKNPTFNRDSLEILRITNQISLPKSVRVNFGRLVSRALDGSDAMFIGLNGDHTFLPPEMRLSIFNKYEEENSRIAREFLNREDGRLFLETPPDPPMPWSPYEGLDASTLVPVIAHCWLHQWNSETRLSKVYEEKNAELNRRIESLEKRFIVPKKNIGRRLKKRLKKMLQSNKK